jgi:hypothetical protein
MIRPMTSAEIRAALRQSAKVCIQQRMGAWYSLAVCPQDGAYQAANGLLHDPDRGGYDVSPEHAATYLLLVAEAV